MRRNAMKNGKLYPPNGVFFGNPVILGTVSVICPLDIPVRSEVSPALYIPFLVVERMCHP